MRKFLLVSTTFVLLLTLAATAQSTPTGTPTQTPSAATDENSQLRQELDQMKKAVASLEELRKKLHKRKMTPNSHLPANNPTTRNSWRR
jgi:uncharacterized protein YlxW (UPF0749 family)